MADTVSTSTNNPSDAQTENENTCLVPTQTKPVGYLPGDQFEQILQHELQQIQKRRDHLHRQASVTTPFHCTTPGCVHEGALQMDLVGVSFSGGGIRSGTVCLGILQALARLQLLNRVDYLSTVSGGGYIHAWLAAWLRREIDTTQLNESTLTPVQAVRNVEKQLTPDRLFQADSERDGVIKNTITESEPEPIHHLRAHSRYLSPRLGLFSPDTWTLISIYIRNLFIIWLVLLPTALCMVLLVRGTIALFNQENVGPIALNVFGAFCIFLACSQGIIRSNLRRLRSTVTSKKLDVDVEGNRRAGLYRFISIWLLLVGGLCGLWAIGIDATPAPVSTPDEEAKPISYSSRLEIEGLIRYVKNSVPGFGSISAGVLYLQNDLGIPRPLLLGATTFGLFGVLVGLVSLLFDSFNRGFRLAPALGFLLLTMINGVCFGGMFGLICDNLLFFYADGSRTADQANSPALIVLLGPPLVLLALVVAGYIEMALARFLITEHEREWRSRMGGLILMHIVSWIAIVLAVVYLPWLVQTQNVRWQSISAWFGATSLGGIALRMLLKKVQSAGLLLKVLSFVIPFLFLMGFLAILSAIVDGFPGCTSTETDFLQRAEHAEPSKIFIALAIFVAISSVSALWFPVNWFSLHNLYGNRLIRCYLGASLRQRLSEDKIRVATPTNVRTHRQPNDFTGFDPNDDIPLVELRMDPPKLDTTDTSPKKPYLGPFPIFNTTLNLIAGTELAYQDRKGESFILTPEYCGSLSTGYARVDFDSIQPSEKQRVADNLTVGRAITVSGAAVDSNMNVFYSPPLMAFLTVLNARMGWWMSNPCYANKPRGLWNSLFGWIGLRPSSKRWEAETPYGSWHLLKEFMGLTTATSDYIHLSDGGHFENTGAYELIRRRCRYIVLVDAAEDPRDASENLANLIRLVRIDFGIRIEIDTSPLRKNEKGQSTAHCAIGVIRYDDVDPNGVTGTLVFIRSSLTGDEPADVLNYAATHPPFPHHGTINQFFDETQFESYRELGFHMGIAIFTEAARRFGKKADQKTITDREYRLQTRDFFSYLTLQFSPTPDGALTNFNDSCQGYMDLVSLLREDSSLQPLSEKLFPEIDCLLEPLGMDKAKALKLLHTTEYMLQVMENAWLKNDLDRFYSHPIHRGWLNVFRRWTSTNVLQIFWPYVRGQFCQGFVRFCERSLNVVAPPVQWKPIPSLEPTMPWVEILKQFDEELFKEWIMVLSRDGWFSSPSQHNGIPNTLTQAVDQSKDLIGLPYAAWILTYGNLGESTGWMKADWNPKRHYPLGLIVVCKHDPQQDHLRPTKSDKGPLLELLIWIRGAHRMLGLGRKALPHLLREMEQPLSKHGSWLYSRYPRIGTSMGDWYQRLIWTRFLNEFDFVSVRRDDLDHPSQFIWLKRGILSQTNACSNQRESGDR